MILKLNLNPWIRESKWYHSFSAISILRPWYGLNSSPQLQYWYVEGILGISNYDRSLTLGAFMMDWKFCKSNAQNLNMYDIIDGGYWLIFCFTQCPRIYVAINRFGVCEQLWYFVYIIIGIYIYIYWIGSWLIQFYPSCIGYDSTSIV